jgi:hypothetical protein
MVDDEEKHGKAKREQMDSENLKEILGAVSSEVPALIKSILSSVFSEESGRSMGKAAAAYYKELKDGGLPEQVAVKLTEDYMRTFTSIGDMLRSGGGMKWSGEAGERLGEEIERKIREKVDKKKQDREEEEEEE